MTRGKVPTADDTLEPKRSRIIAMGLPSSGKTTFLAALWHSVEQGSPSSSLRLSNLQTGDRSYLNRIASEWADGKSLGRTLSLGGATVRMNLRDTRTGQTFELEFPDLAGEVFRDAWATRLWPPEVGELASEAKGVLLFVSPDVVEPVRLDSANRIFVRAGGIEPEVERGSPSGAPIEANENPWDPTRAPHSVILVDLLQAVAAASSTRLRRRVGIVVSAWDLIDPSVKYLGSARVVVAGGHTGEANHRTDPRVWIHDRMPLLDQYLRNAIGDEHVRVYGLTAQGGDLTIDAGAIQSAVRPEERIRVVADPSAMSDGETEGDITSIIRWVEGQA